MTSPALLPVAPEARLYLVTEAGFLGRFIAVVSTALLALWVASHFEAAVGLLDSVSHRLQFQLIIYANQSSQHSQLLGWFLLSMLSSSCCALQLFLGLFSFGCAGFNTVLGPLRPGFLAFTLLAQGWMWKTILDQPARASYQASALATGLSIALSFLPEALHYGFASGPLGRGTKGRNATVIVEFDVEGLGCIACSKTIARVLSGHDAVRNVKVTIETGIVAAELDTAAKGTSAAGGQAAKTAADDTADIAKELAVLMDEAGFPAVPRRTENATVAGEKTASSATSASDKPQGPAATAPQGWWDVLSCVVAGLASSSCCLLQLALNGLSSLNVLHVGCAGFNKTLGPIRTPLRVISLAYLGGLWVFTARRGISKRRVLLNTLLTLALMFLPVS